MEEPTPAPSEPAPMPEEKKTKKWLPLVAILVVVILVAAAGAVLLLGGGQQPVQVLDRVEVTPATATLSVGALGASFTAVARESGGAEITGVTVGWSVSPTAGATMSATSGRTISVRVYSGTTFTLTASVTHGGVTRTDTAAVTVAPYANSLDLAAPGSVVSRTDFTATVSVLNQFGSAFSGYSGTVTLQSTDKGAGTVMPAAYTFDGTVSSADFTIRLGTPGRTWTVYANDTANSSLAASVDVAVTNQNPVAQFSFLATGDNVDFDAAASADPDGTIASYAWDFDDGNTGTGQTPSHSYALAGAYNVALTVTDNLGGTGSITKSVAVNVGPTASFEAYPSGLDVVVDASGSSDSDGTIATYAWAWDDGSPVSSGVNVSHSYAAAGTYNITLTVTDNSGATDSAYRLVTAKAPPVAVLAIRAGLLPNELIANASGSSDPDGVVVSFNVDWGDGNVTSGVPFVNETSHIYFLDGNYTITLTVYDNDGFSDSTSTVRCVGLLCGSQPVAVLDYAPQPAVAMEPVTFDGSGSYDLNPARTIVQYDFEFGDGTNATTNETTPWAVHFYAVYGTYRVNLTVWNDLGQSNTTSMDVTVLSRPLASFTYSVAVLDVSVDGSASSDLDGSIVNYTWDWGDGAITYGVTSSHTYASAADFDVTLFVTDNDGLVGTSMLTVSLGTSSLDYTFYDFFNVPWGEWWDMRTPVYGDLPVGAECFSPSGVLNGFCTPSDPGIPDVASYPYVNWYPSAAGTPPPSDPLLYAPYRFDVVGTNISGFDMGEPVFIPDCDDLAWSSRVSGGGLPPDWGDWTCPTDLPASGGATDFEVFLQYLTIDREVIIATGAAPDDCPDLTGSNDGFIIESYFNLTMDYTASRRLFGVAGDPATWWGDNTRAGCGPAGKFDAKSGNLEKAYNWWLLVLGNGPHDVFSSFEYPYQGFFTDITWSVNVVGGQNYTSISVHHGAWGLEVLFSRLSYYGRTNYSDAILTAAEPQGWWDMELAWFEDLSMSGNLTETSMNFTLSSVMQYHFQELALPGTDGLWNTPDDEPIWTWSPILTDYIYSTGAHVYSELDPYEGIEYFHTTPGSVRYATNYIFDYVPRIWKITARQSWTFLLPSADAGWHYPNDNPAGTAAADYVQTDAPITYSYSTPVGLGTWDSGNRRLVIVGPINFPNPPMMGIYPLESRPIFVFRRA